MKKYIVVALIVLVGGALIILPLLKEDETIVGGLAPATFTKKGDFATSEGKKSTFEITLNEQDVSKVELIYDDEVLKTWKNPTGNLKFTFTPEKIGTRSLRLMSTRKDGRPASDDRRLRVVSDIIPDVLVAKRISTYGHNVLNYTQGLEFYNGRLIESTGEYGKSRITEIDLETGDDVGNSIGLDATYFGEGITVFNGTIYQVTWKKGRCFTYSLEDSIVPLLDDFIYGNEKGGQEGWGLCNDGTSLIMSDGTERIYFKNPKTFQTERVIEVYSDRGPMTQLNELEYIDGEIYANVYTTNLIVAIDPATGKITKQIDCSSLEKIGRGSGNVLNGIAHNKETGKTYVTGKNWLNLFEVEFSKN